MGLYVYAVVQADGRSPAPMLGLLEQPVYEVAAGGLAAIVSDYPAAVVRPERKHIAADQAVMRNLYSERDMLPMAFGTITQSKKALVDFIEQQSPALSAQLLRVAGCIEMGVRLSLEVDDLAAYIVARTPALKAARDQAYARRRTPSHDEMLRLGQAFDSALTVYRDSQAIQLVDAVTPACREVAALPVRTEKGLANLAMLVPRDGLSAFGATMDVIAAGFGDEMVFRLTGPWPPYNFVTFVESLH